MRAIWINVTAALAIGAPVHGQGMRVRVTFTSTVEIRTPAQSTVTPTISPTGMPVKIRKEHAGAVLKATGSTTFDATLGPGALQDEDYEFVTPAQGIMADVAWTGVSVTGGPCTHDVAPSPPTTFNFWLGLSGGATPKAALVASPEGGEFHDIVSRNCAKGIGGSGRNKMPIFSQAWIALYGSGADGDDGSAKGPGDALAMTQGMDMAKMMKMQKEINDKLKKEGKDPKNLSDADAQKLAREMMSQPDAMDMTKQVGKNAEGHLEKALDNFMIKMEGPQVTGRATFADYTITRDFKLPGGQGTVSEHTRIVVVQLAGSRP